MIFSLPGRKKKERADTELLELYRTGKDLAALGELYSRYMHLVYGVCLKYLKNRDESMDSVMLIFEKLVSEIPKHDINNFKSWLHVVTRNFCLMRLRSEKNMMGSIEDWINDETVFMEYSPVVHPIDEEEGQDMEKALADCIERLRAEQRDCIRMFYYDDLCYNEIARGLGIDEKKVKSHLQNGKRNLKLCLEGKNENQE
ncbi:MAG: sigma-70 family RNA polymerase sigma factor [Bacteroidales bacterium]